MGWDARALLGASPSRPSWKQKKGEERAGWWGLSSAPPPLHPLTSLSLSLLFSLSLFSCSFGADPAYPLPPAFYADFMRGAAEETSHFRALEQRLVDTGYAYGSFPAHDGLWASAASTAHSLPARLAVEHCVHEARGLDTLPATIAKFRTHGDGASVAVLEGVIYPEEVTHCAAGVRWLTWLHGVATGEGAVDAPAAAVAAARGTAWAAEARGHPTPQAWFHSLVRAHFAGSLKPPFNSEARMAAGFTEEWYLPLATPPGGAGVAGGPGSRAGPKEA